MGSHHRRDSAVPRSHVIHWAASRKAILPEQEIQSLAKSRLADAIPANDDRMTWEDDLALGDTAEVCELEPTYPHRSVPSDPALPRATVAAGIR